MLTSSQHLCASPTSYALNEQGEREVVSTRWGSLGRATRALPGRSICPHSETSDRLPTFANAFAHGRGILLVHTFYEGEELPNGKTKQWVIGPNGGQPIAIVVICEKWTNGDETLDTFIQMTTPANALISKITDRMPAILQPEDRATWLGERQGGPSDVKMVLRTFDDGGNWTMAEQGPEKKAQLRRMPGRPVILDAEIANSCSKSCLAYLRDVGR